MKKLFLFIAIFVLMLISFFFGAFFENYRANIFKLKVHLLQYDQMVNSNYGLMKSSLQVFIIGDYETILDTEKFIPEFFKKELLNDNLRKKIQNVEKEKGEKIVAP